MRTYKLILLLFLVCNVSMYAQKTKTVSGSVCDDNNAPLIGATVMVKGTTNGTIVDVDGKYSLKVVEGDILQNQKLGKLIGGNDTRRKKTHP